MMSSNTHFQNTWLKRRSQYSTVAFIKTSDPKRLPQFIRFIDGVYRSSKKKAPYRIFLYRVWSGLYEVEVKGDEIITTPVREQVAASALAQAAGVGAVHIRDLGRALVYLDRLLRKEQRIIVIFWGLFSYKGVSDREYYDFIKFLRDAIYTDEYYVKYHFIIVFTETPELIADDDTLKHSIVASIPRSTKEERIKILSEIAKRYGLTVNDAEIEKIADITKGLNLHEVESVALESLFRYGRYDFRIMTEYKYDIVRKSGVLDVQEPAHGFDAVGGYDILKRFVEDNVISVLRAPARAAALGLRPPRGVLLFGPPGTGKTWFALALARELGLPFLRLRTEKIVSKWYGETSRLMARALEIAEAVAPAVLFVDEIDRFGRRGQLGEHEESRRAFSILLEWLGDPKRKTIIIGTTNRPEDLDEAFRRVGRFDYIIPVLYPDAAGRREILRVHTSVVRRVPLAADVDFDRIVAATEYWSGAELEELVLRAARRALRDGADKVSMKHFEAALETFRVNRDERVKQLEHYMRLAEEYTNDAEFLQQLRRAYNIADRVGAIKEF